ncbi:MAG TPA: histidine phosphatase family protein [Pyrinomonadaceae bacterium]|nr:histidine phosphatase family protein [Pyrinomonadaceae bacterium]
MKTLYLLRHAKSSWDDPGLKDFDRPLNKRGLKAAPRLGAYLLKEKIRPDLILSSPAVRAKETTTLVCEAAGLSSLITFDERVYEASVQRLFEIVAGFADSINTAMMVGHNPGFEELLAALTGESLPMPTASLACTQLRLEKWSELTAGVGKLVWLVKAKELK